MAAQQAQFKVKLNLLFPQGEEPKLASRFLKWVLSYGRYMAIFVEAIVIIALLTQYKYDSELAGINNQINSQIQQINQSSTPLINVSQTQTKLAQIQKVYGSTPDWTDFFNKLAASFPTGASMSQLTIDSSQASGIQFKITGIAASNNDLALLISALNSNGFTGVTLTNTSVDQGQINFSLDGAK